MQVTAQVCPLKLTDSGCTVRTNSRLCSPRPRPSERSQQQRGVSQQVTSYSRGCRRGVGICQIPPSCCRSCSHDGIGSSGVHGCGVSRRVGFARAAVTAASMSAGLGHSNFLGMLVESLCLMSCSRKAQGDGERGSSVTALAFVGGPWYTDRGTRTGSAFAGIRQGSDRLVVIVHLGTRCHHVMCL